MGTRLRSVVKDMPKPMAPINSKPFLCYILDELVNNEIKHIILAIGFRGELIIDYFGDNYKGVRLSYSSETTPLGTGGAIKKALIKTDSEYVLIVNGDTYIDLDLCRLMEFHLEKKSEITIGAKQIEDASRYGAIEFDSNGRIVQFIEKGELKKGYISCGAYIIKKSIIENLCLQESFSFEKEILEEYVNELKIYAAELIGNFIDIGVPDDYYRAQEVLRSN